MSTTLYSFGDVVLVPIQFTDFSGTKQRPAVIVSSSSYNSARQDVIVMPATSQIHTPPYFGEIVIKEWKPAGFPKPSVIKPLFFTLEKTQILKRMGKLRQPDSDALVAAIPPLLGP